MYVTTFFNQISCNMWFLHIIILLLIISLYALRLKKPTFATVFNLFIVFWATSEGTQIIPGPSPGITPSSAQQTIWDFRDQNLVNCLQGNCLTPCTIYTTPL